MKKGEGGQVEDRWASGGLNFNNTQSETVDQIVSTCGSLKGTDELHRIDWDGS